MIFFSSFSKPRMRSQKRDRHFLKFFCIRVEKRNVLVSSETFWLMASGRATREALLSEACFENVFPNQTWVSCFVDHER